MIFILNSADFIEKNKEISLLVINLLLFSFAIAESIRFWSSTDHNFF